MALAIASAQVEQPAVLHDSGPVFMTGSRAWRLHTAVLVSLLLHALLLSLSLGGDGAGLPGLRFSWEERRLAATDLQVVLAPAQSATEARATAPASAMPLPAAAPPPMLTTAPASAHVLAPRPAPVQAPPPESVTRIDSKAGEPASARLPPAPVAAVAPDVRVDDAVLAREAERMALAAQDTARQEQLLRENARAAQAALEQAVRKEAESHEQARLNALARQEAARQERERAASAQLEAAREEQAKQAELKRQEAARAELERAEAARQDALKQEAARQAASTREAARQEAIKQETARQEAARQEAVRQEAVRQEAARQEAARQEAAKQEAAKQEAAKQEAARQEVAQREQARQAHVQQERAAQEAKREERLRAIGRQLDQEAAQRDAANRAPGALPPTTSSLRRGWLLGRADPNRDLILYAEAMARKIELNPTTIDTVREVVKQPHVRPAVTVAVRADGSVERVTFAVSSNVPAIDEAIRKVIASQAPYGPFPPALARQYDVIEIRRTWIFDVAIRLE